MYTIKFYIDLLHMYYVLLSLQPPAFAGSGHALFYEGHIEKQKENFVMCGRNTQMRRFESFPFNVGFLSIVTMFRN